jgi:ribosomal protein S18 acetylase RimI-like enzyme
MLTWNSMAGTVTKLAVHQGSRRLGVAEALMSAAIEVLRKVRGSLLTARTPSFVRVHQLMSMKVSEGNLLAARSQPAPSPTHH